LYGTFKGRKKNDFEHHKHELQTDIYNNDNQILEIESEVLKMLMEQLPTNDRIILLMKYLDNMSIADISDSLNTKTSAVKMRLKRAREALLFLYKKTGDQNA